ncbi:5052_t:CDS:2, partial [Dentiscutata erythropus]
MASTSISIEDPYTHNREQVTMIVCSPNLKYIATWSDMNKSAVFWSIPDNFDNQQFNQQQLKPEHTILLEKYKDRNKYKVYSNSDIEPSSDSETYGDIKNYFTVSDDKFVAMPIKRIEVERSETEQVEIEKAKSEAVSKIEDKCDLKTAKKYGSRVQIGIFNFKTEEYLSLSLPHSEIMVESLAFLDENYLIMISKYPLCRIYIFTHEKNKFIHKSTIKMESYNEKTFLSNGKLFIYDENLGSITKWDIKTLKFEAYFLFDNSFNVDNMKMSDNEILFFVYGTKRTGNLHKDPYPCISIYSADHGNKFTTFYLIASDIGARLLIVYHRKNEESNKYHYSICDPFAPYIPDESYINADHLFKDFEAERDKNFEYKYIVKSDKVVGFIKNDLVIKKLIPDNWIFYLRETLKDSNSIFISSDSEKIIDLIRRAAKDIETTVEVEKTYSKYFITWTLKYENNNKYIFLTAKFKNDKTSIQIVPEIYINSGMDNKGFINECDCLNSGDLVMITFLGVEIWTFNAKDNKIELKYCWNDEGVWDWDKENVINLFNDEKKIKKRYFFPPSSYIGIIRYSSVFSQPSQLHNKNSNGDKDRFFFNELIENHINNKFFLMLYGKKLIEDIIKDDDDELLRKLFKGELRKFIGYINSDDWEESTKPITTRIMKVIKDEGQESETEKIQSIKKTVEDLKEMLAK